MGCFFLANALKSNTALEYMILTGGREEAIGLSGLDTTAQALRNTIKYQSDTLVKSYTYTEDGYSNSIWAKTTANKSPDLSLSKC